MPIRNVLIHNGHSVACNYFRRSKMNQTSKTVMATQQTVDFLMEKGEQPFEISIKLCYILFHYVVNIQQ